MRKAVFVCVVLGLGLLATLLPGFYRQDFSTSGTKAIRYGLPLSWHGEHGSASSSPTAWYAWDSFAFDAAAWCFALGIFVLITRERERE
jgi:hypothetical protein